ncbi:NUMOD3 domain-containing DNA-binding protein [uncultured Clostridium sp.]|uniref:NUMOD3 domain-containing DNA-binding protein n=1 Tax=uncultured Clostridium sp. TaxID=59620 RepID=UPI003217FE66
MCKEYYGIIYVIKNMVNKKVYVGQTTIGFKARYDNTDWWKKTHNTHLKSSVNKYGVENFEVIEEFDIAYSLEELNKKEIYWINFYNSNNRKYGYNKKEGGSRGKHSIESIEKMKKAHFGAKLSKETKQKMSEVRKGKRLGKDNPMYGKNPLKFMSEDDYNKLMQIKSNNMIGENNPMHGAYGELNPFYGKEHSDKTKSVISSKAKERYKDRKNHPSCKPVAIHDKDGVEVGSFNSFISCSEWLLENNIIKNIRTGVDAIYRSMKNNKSYKGFTFKYADGQDKNSKDSKST